jgi:hypothetical protein
MLVAVLFDQRREILLDAGLFARVLNEYRRMRYPLILKNVHSVAK